MRNFSRIILPLILALGLANGKEANGVFVGLELGFSENQLELKAKVSGYERYNTKSTLTALAVGGKVGYKHFFLDWVGVRGYVSVGGALTSSKNTNKGTSSTTTFSDVIYAVNADALFNFYSSDSLNAGAFVGIGLGGQNFSTNAFTTTYEISDFYGDVKIGLRVNTATNHEVEFIAKIPYYKATKTFDSVVEAKAKQNYQILLGYNYAF